MITNEKQYRSTKASIGKLTGAFAALEAPTSDFPEVFAKAQRSALRSQIDELDEEGDMRTNASARAPTSRASRVNPAAA